MELHMNNAAKKKRIRFKTNKYQITLDKTVKIACLKSQ